jgi:uncharacterized membrane protein
VQSYGFGKKPHFLQRVSAHNTGIVFELLNGINTKVRHKTNGRNILFTSIAILLLFQQNINKLGSNVWDFIFYVKVFIRLILIAMSSNWLEIQIKTIDINNLYYNIQKYVCLFVWQSVGSTPQHDKSLDRYH